MNMFSLQGRVALVTRSRTCAWGWTIARGLAAQGAHVLVNGRDDQAVARAVASLREGGGSVDGLVFDVAQPEKVQAALAELDAKAGRLDILVNNVGIRDRRSVFEFTLDDVRRMLEVNLVAPFALCREAAQRMIAAGKGGRIIKRDIDRGPIANVNDAAYTSAKGGLAALTRALAAELRSARHHGERRGTRLLRYRDQRDCGRRP